uniref:Uncharacterized protein n=1 Tax=Picea sitchensis TaxID=3332 RepID=D5A9B1_PICSI|nr:unknown [Picea sitchensis]
MEIIIDQVIGYSNYYWNKHCYCWCCYLLIHQGKVGRRKKSQKCDMAFHPVLCPDLHLTLYSALHLALRA